MWIKRVVAVTVLIFFTLAVWSAVLAAQGPSLSGLPQYVKFHAFLKKEGSQVDRGVLGPGEDDRKLLEFSQDFLAVGEPGDASLQKPRIITAPLIIVAPKVSTNIFLSVLNL